MSWFDDLTFEEQVDFLKREGANIFGIRYLRELTLEKIEGLFPVERKYGPSGHVTAVLVGDKRIETPDAVMTQELADVIYAWCDEQERLQGEKE